MEMLTTILESAFLILDRKYARQTTLALRLNLMINLGCNSIVYAILSFSGVISTSKPASFYLMGG